MSYAIIVIISIETEMRFCCPVRRIGEGPILLHNEERVIRKECGMRS
jgi:hypothetical protein